jgi:hypothetical protein
MSAAGLEGIDHAVQQAHIRINDVEKGLDWNNKPGAYRVCSPSTASAASPTS